MNRTTGAYYRGVLRGGAVGFAVGMLVTAAPL